MQRDRGARVSDTAEHDRLRADHAKKYLDTVRAARVRLERQHERRSEQLERMGVKAAAYDGMPKNPNACSDAIPDGVAKLDAISEAEAQAASEWGEALAQAAKSLNAMPNPVYAELLERRYINGEIWGCVAAGMSMSASWCQYSRIPALVQLYDTMPSEYRIPRVPAI